MVAPADDGTVILTGTSGEANVDLTTKVDGTAWFQYSPTFAGSFTMQNVPTGLGVVFSVYDDERDLLYTDSTGGTVSYVADADETFLIAVRSRSTVEILDVTWSYAGRASSRLVVDLDGDEVRETPGGLTVNIANGTGLDGITFSLVGPVTVADFATTTLNEAGSLDDLTVPLPALLAGDYLLRVEGVVSGSEDVPFTVLEDALSMDNLDPKAPPVPPTLDSANRWRLVSLDRSRTYQFVHNPRSWTNVFPPTEFTHDNTTAPDGQMLTWQAGERPWRMEFTGYLETEDEYTHLAFWASLRRRFWLIDHRNRTWLVTFEHFDAQARVVPNKPWAHDYTMKTLIFMQGKTN